MRILFIFRINVTQKHISGIPEHGATLQSIALHPCDFSEVLFYTSTCFVSLKFAADANILWETHTMDCNMDHRSADGFSSTLSATPASAAASWIWHICAIISLLIHVSAFPRLPSGLITEDGRLSPWSSTKV